MFKPLMALGVFGASISTVALTQDSAATGSESVATTPISPDSRGGSAAPAGPSIRSGAAADARPAVPASSADARGIRFEPVPTELAAHLGIVATEGVLVAAVAKGSAASEAGLGAYDVILSVNGETATPTEVDAAFASEAGIALLVVRGGVQRRVALSGTGGDANFLSSDSLGPDHPFRRLASLQSLREGYSTKADEYSQRMRQLDEKSRLTREEAKKEMATLQKLCEDQVAQYLGAREEVLLALVDEHMNPERVEPLMKMRVDLSALVPDERIRAVEDDLQALDDLFRNALGERLQPTGEEVPDELVNRARQRASSLGNEAAGLLAERVKRPWTSALKELGQHRERLGQKHDERMKWTSKTVRETRDKVKDRVRCAVERAREQLSQKLRSRLQRMEVPAAGEIEGALTDVDAQLDAFARRFIRRTEIALDRYEDEVRTCRERLLPALEEGLVNSERAVTELEAAVTILVAKGIPETLPASRPRWRTCGQIDRLYDDARAELLDTINAGRGTTRAGTSALATEVQEEKVVTEDAWRDLKKLLSELRQSAESDCWKLDGPHLDGRFPRPEQEPESKGEVVMAR